MGNSKHSILTKWNSNISCCSKYGTLKNVASYSWSHSRVWGTIYICAFKKEKRIERIKANSIKFRQRISSWFQTFAVFWMSYSFFWVNPWHLNFMCRHYGTPMKVEQTVCSETSAYKIQMPGIHPQERIQHISSSSSSLCSSYYFFSSLMILLLLLLHKHSINIARTFMDVSHWFVLFNEEFYHSTLLVLHIDWLTPLWGAVAVVLLSESLASSHWNSGNWKFISPKISHF